MQAYLCTFLVCIFLAPIPYFLLVENHRSIYQYIPYKYFPPYLALFHAQRAGEIFPVDYCYSQYIPKSEKIVDGHCMNSSNDNFIKANQFTEIERLELNSMYVPLLYILRKKNLLSDKEKTIEIVNHFLGKTSLLPSRFRARDTFYVSNKLSRSCKKNEKIYLKYWLFYYQDLNSQMLKSPIIELKYDCHSKVFF